jgi:hypothetical protein
MAVGGFTVMLFRLSFTLIVMGKIGPYQSQFVVMLSASTLVRSFSAHFIQHA